MTRGYRELPVDSRGLRRSWEEFGPGDELGTLNRLTDDAVRAATAEIRTGARVSITLPLDQPDPPHFGRGAYRHTVFSASAVVQDDYLDNFYLQGSSQWDGLRHRCDPEHGFYGGVTAADAGPEGDRLGVGAWAAQGIVGRAVLADVEGYLSRIGTPYSPTEPFSISAELISDVLADQGTQTGDGDVLLVRTGYVGAYLRSDRAGRTALSERIASAGLSPDDDIAELLWDGGFAAVAVDNPAVEVLPRDDGRPHLHGRLLPMLGLPMGEWFTFEELVVACQLDGRYSGFLCSVPLNLPRGVGSPANAVVVR